MNTNQIIRKLCALNKVTLEELAHEIGFTLNGLQKMLKADDYKLSVLKAIAKKLKVSVSQLIGEAQGDDQKELAFFKEKCIVLEERLERIQEVLGNFKSKTNNNEGSELPQLPDSVSLQKTGTGAKGKN